MMNKLYAVERKSNSNGEYETVIINNFGGEIVDIKIVSLSPQATGYECILFLMKDGTVEYTPLCEAYRNNEFKAYGKIEGVTNIVRLAKVIETRSITGWRNEVHEACVAIKSDGSFYNLTSILLDKMESF